LTFVRTSSLLGVVMVAGSILTGCTESSSGDPRPASEGTSTAATSQPTSQKPTSDRPREIKLDGKDPCVLIPQSDWAKFEIEKPGKREVNSASKEPLCGYNTSLAAFNLTLNAKEGIEVWDEKERAIHIEGTDPILDFPAVNFTQSSPKSACSAVIDVADGQTLDVMAIVSSREALPRKCEIAREFAESAMKTLLGGN